MNEIANLCERTGADVDMVRKGMGSDNRIGKRFLFPGIGYGGSCFPKDVKALIHTAQEHDYSFRILQEVVQINETQKQTLIKKLKNYFNHDMKNKEIAIWGLAFKPNTDAVSYTHLDVYKRQVYRYLFSGYFLNISFQPIVQSFLLIFPSFQSQVN